MSDKIKVRHKKTGVERYVTIGALKLLEGVYEVVSENNTEPIKTTPPAKKKAVEPVEDDIEAVRKEYQALIGEIPDKRKGIQTLKEEIEEFKSGNNTDE